MRAGILCFRPSVLFFALALVMFVTVVALNAGESSAKLNCDPATGDCSGGGASNFGTGGGGGRSTDDSVSGGGGFGTQEGTYEGRGGHASCNFEAGECTTSGGGKEINEDQGFGGRCVTSITNPPDCTPRGRF